MSLVNNLIHLLCSCPKTETIYHNLRRRNGNDLLVFLLPKPFSIMKTNSTPLSMLSVHQISLICVIDTIITLREFVNLVALCIISTAKHRMAKVITLQQAGNLHVCTFLQIITFRSITYCIWSN